MRQIHKEKNHYSYLLIMHGNNSEFSKQEFTSLFSTYFSDEHFTLTQIQNSLYKLTTSIELPSFNHPLFTRITLTKGVYKLLTYASNLDSLLENLALKTYEYEESFAVDQINIKTKANIKNSTLAYPIGRQLAHLHADLNHAQHKFYYIFIPNTVFLTECIFENKKTYLERMPVKRAINKPYTLKADMARACINLLKVKENSIVVDPFCGVGGIILEGLDMNIEMIGNDINTSDIEHTKTNCTHFNYSLPTLFCVDSKLQFLKHNSVDGIVSDIPYGRSSRRLGKELYEDFVKSAYNMLKPEAKMVIVYGCFTHFKPIALQYFEEVAEIEQYMNASLTRYILVLKKTKNS